VEKLRKAVPDITLTTDIIVGFPGETEQDFAMTEKMLEEVQYDAIFAFRYSKRPGTAALKLGDHLPDDVKEERLSHILNLQKAITIAKNKKLLDTVQEILIEGKSKKGETMTGRTRGNKAVNVAGSSSLIGSLVHARITAVGVNSFSGEICE
jgi:tRNA-2-methylthio-N6-dimethylallyladenosine synthase